MNECMHFNFNVKLTIHFSYLFNKCAYMCILESSKINRLFRRREKHCINVKSILTEST